MKRIYIQPETKITVVKPTSVICASVQFGTGDTSTMDGKDDSDLDWSFDDFE